jgi:hypothetical protein
VLVHRAVDSPLAVPRVGHSARSITPTRKYHGQNTKLEKADQKSPAQNRQGETAGQEGEEVSDSRQAFCAAHCALTQTVIGGFHSIAFLSSEAFRRFAFFWVRAKHPK